MIVRCHVQKNATVFVRETFVKNIVRVHQRNARIVFRAVVVDHRVQPNNVHVMQRHENVIRIYVHRAERTIFEMEIRQVRNRLPNRHVHVIMLPYNVVYTKHYY